MLCLRLPSATAVGNTRWSYSFGSNYGVRGFTMTHDGSVLFIFLADPRMLAVDATTGKVLFSQQQFGIYTDFDFWLYNYQHGSRRPMLDATGSRVYVGEYSYPHHAVRGYNTVDGTTEISFDGQLASMSDSFSAFVVHNDSITFLAPSEAFALELTCEGARSGDADSDGICDDLDSCPDDIGNDPDGDGVCTAVDSCPADFEVADADSDGVCGRLPTGTVWQYVDNSPAADLTVILAVMDDAVYVGTSSSKVLALSLGWNSSSSTATTNTADVLWTMTTGRPAVAATLLPSPDGPAYGSVLYVTAEDYNMYAVNTTNGAILWRTCGLTGEIESPRGNSDGSILFAMVSSTLTAFDARNGTILWEYRDYGFYTGYYDQLAVVVMPTTGGDVVVVSSDYGQSATAFDTSGSLLWELDLGLGYSYYYYYDNVFMVATADTSKTGSHWPLPVTGDMIYFAEDNFPTYQHFAVSAVNVSNGSVAWSRIVDCSILRHLAPPVSIEGDTLFAFCAEPAIFAMDAASGLMRWVAHDLDGATEFDMWGTPTRSLPSISGAYVYTGEAAEGQPRRYSTADGTLDASFVDAIDVTALNVESFALAPNGQVLIGMTPDRVFAVLTHDNETTSTPPVPRSMPPPADLIPVVPGPACSGEPRSAQVLFLENTYDEDAYQWVVEALGLSAVVVTNSEWAAMTTTDFHKYRAIVFGDGIGQSASAVQAAVDNSAVWSAAIDGNIFVVGSDDATHPEGAQGLIPRAMAYVVEADCKTGLYVSLARYYQSSLYYPVSVPVLQSIGDFSVVSAGCADAVHSVAYHDVVLKGLSDAHMSNWGCTAHEVFVDFPDSFTALAIVQDISTAYPAVVQEYSDGSKGAPFMLISGEAIVLDCSPNTTVTCTGAGPGSCRYVYPELHLSQTEASLIGGDIVTVTGPCFDDTSKWLCMFGGTTVPVNVLSAVAGECTVPVGNEPGAVIFAVLRDDGTFTSGLQTTLFTYSSPFVIGDVNITFDDGELHELNLGFDGNSYTFFADGDVLTVEWDESAEPLDNFMAVDIVLIEVMFTGTKYDLAVVARLATATANDGEESVQVPAFTPVLDENYTGFSIVGVALLPPTTPSRWLSASEQKRDKEQAEGRRFPLPPLQRRRRRSLFSITSGTHAGSSSLLESPLALFLQRGQTCADWARADAALHGTLPPPTSPGGAPVPCPQTNPTVGRWACAGIWDPEDRSDGRICLSHATSGAHCCYSSIGVLIESGLGVANLRMHDPAVDRFAAIAHDVLPWLLCKSEVFDRYSSSQPTSRRSLAAMAEAVRNIPVVRSAAGALRGARRLEVEAPGSNTTMSAATTTTSTTTTTTTTTSTTSRCVRWSTVPVTTTLLSTSFFSSTTGNSSNTSTSMPSTTTSLCVEWSTASSGSSTSTSSSSSSTTTSYTTTVSSSYSKSSTSSTSTSTSSTSTSTYSTSTSTSYSTSTSTSYSTSTTSSYSTSTTSSYSTSTTSSHSTSTTSSYSTSTTSSHSTSTTSSHSTSTTSSHSTSTTSSYSTSTTSSHSTSSTSSHSTSDHLTTQPHDDENYDDRRPPNGGVPSVPTGTVCPRTAGDAHFVTADGLSYTFNGIGQYSLVSHLAGHFEVAIELAPLGEGSVSNGAAVLDRTRDVVYEVHPGDGVSGIVLFVNGKPLLVPPSPNTHTHYKLGPDFTVNYAYARVQLRWPKLGISGTFW